MSIKGFQGTSLLDFPQRIAALVFLSGCNLRCPYCHNPGLIVDPQNYPDLSLAEVLEQLHSRLGFIDGVVVSGGEPTLEPDLPELLKEFKKLGLQVKLDTNGLRPQMLNQLLDQQLVDYVAMDVKTSPVHYKRLFHGEVDTAALLRSVDLLQQAAVEVEFRTTCMPGLIEEADIHAIGQLLHGAPLWVLQQFVPEYAMSEQARCCRPHTTSRLKALGELAGGYVKKVMLRGL